MITHTHDAAPPGGAAWRIRKDSNLRRPIPIGGLSPARSGSFLKPGADFAVYESDMQDWRGALGRLFGLKTVDEAVGRWLDGIEARASDYRPGTLRSHRVTARSLRELVGTRRLASWTEADTAALRRQLEGQPARCRRVLWLLRVVLELAEGWGWASVDTGHIGRYRPREVQREAWLTRDEASRVIVHGYGLIEALPPGSPRCGVACVLLLLLTGARVSEICGSTRRDLRLWTDEQGTLRGGLRVPIGQAKTRRARTIPLSPRAAKLIQRLLDEHESDWLLPSGRVAGKPIGRVTVTRQWQRIKADLALPAEYRVHDLRHTFASLAVQEGASLHLLQQVLGHSEPKVTQRYAHLRFSDQFKISDLVQDVTGGSDVG